MFTDYDDIRLRSERLLTHEFHNLRLFIVVQVRFEILLVVFSERKSFGIRIREELEPSPWRMNEIEMPSKTREGELVHRVRIHTK